MNQISNFSHLGRLQISRISQCHLFLSYFTSPCPKFGRHARCYKFQKALGKVQYDPKSVNESDLEFVTLGKITNFKNFSVSSIFVLFHFTMSKIWKTCKMLQIPKSSGQGAV